MATKNKNAGGPYGPTPQFIRDGVMYREADFVGNSDKLYVTPENPERTAKGDLGMAVIPNFESKALTGGLPWKNLKKGR